MISQAVVVLAVEGTQRVELGALAALIAQLFVGVIEDELLNLLAISRTALGVTHRVDERTEASGKNSKPRLSGELVHEHDDALGVCRRYGGSAEPLDAHLVETGAGGPSGDARRGTWPQA